MLKVKPHTEIFHCKYIFWNYIIYISILLHAKHAPTILKYWIFFPFSNYVGHIPISSVLHGIALISLVMFVYKIYSHNFFLFFFYSTSRIYSHPPNSPLFTYTQTHTHTYTHIKPVCTILFFLEHICIIL